MTDIVERLRATELQSWKLDCEAADEIERLRAELSRCGRENCMGRRVDGVRSWVTLDAHNALRAERDALLAAAAKYRLLSTCSCGDEFTLLDPGTCENCR